MKKYNPNKVSKKNEESVERIFNLYRKMNYNFISRRSCEKILKEVGTLPESDTELTKLLIEQI